MKLESKGSWKKFESIGDSIRGRFMSYEKDVSTDLGSQDVLTLKNEEGMVKMGCPSWLKNIMRSHESEMDSNQVLTITLTELRESKTKGYSPTKVFDVDAKHSPPSSKSLQSTGNGRQAQPSRPQHTTTHYEPLNLDVEKEQRLASERYERSDADEDEIPFDGGPAATQVAGPRLRAGAVRDA